MQMLVCRILPLLRKGLDLQACPGLLVGDLLALILVGLRQGFHWSRPVIDLKTGVETPHGKHKVFLPMNDDPAPPWVWNKANVQSVGGGFLVVP